MNEEGEQEELGVAAGMTDFRCELITHIFAANRDEAWDYFIARIGGKTHADDIEIEEANR